MTDDKVARRLGVKVRLLREQAQMTQEELAEKIGVDSKSTVSLIESGARQPSLKVLIRLADAFQVTTDYLLRDELDMM